MERVEPIHTILSGKLEVGACLRITVHPPGRKPMKFKPEVLSLRPGEEILWGGSYGILFRADHEILLEPLSGGGTRFRQIERFRGPVVLFIGGIIKSSEKGYHEMNEALKRRVEGTI